MNFGLAGEVLRELRLVRGAIHHRRPADQLEGHLVVAVRHAVELVETLLQRQASRLIAQVPLADDARAVTGGLQHFRQRDLRRSEPVGSLGPNTPVIPSRAWCRPVKSAARVGEHTGALE